MSRIVLLGVAGIGTAWLLAVAFGDTPAAASEVVALAAGAALALSSLGLVVTHHLGQRPLSVYLWVAALTTVLGIVAGHGAGRLAHVPVAPRTSGPSSWSWSRQRRSAV